MGCCPPGRWPALAVESSAGDLNQFRQYIAELRRRRTPELEVNLPLELVERSISALRLWLRLVDSELRTNLVLCFVDGLEGTCRHEGEDRASKARDFAAGYEHGTSENVRVDLIQDRIVLRDASAVDHSLCWCAVFAHAVENHA